MVLQNKYKRAASARYRSNRLPGVMPETDRDPQFGEHANRAKGGPARGSAQIADLSEAHQVDVGEDEVGDDDKLGGRRSFGRRPLRSNADRYREPDILSNTDGEPVSKDDTNDDTDCNAHMTAQLDSERDAFSAKLRALILQEPSVEPKLIKEDVDEAFEHLFHGHVHHTSVSPGKRPEFGLHDTGRRARVTATSKLKAHVVEITRLQQSGTVASESSHAIELDHLFATLDDDRERERRDPRQPPTPPKRPAAARVGRTTASGTLGGTATGTIDRLLA